jgi:hypothetical protein
VIVCLDRSLVFPSVEYSRYMIMKSGNTWAKGTLPVVIDCDHIQFADYTAAQVLTIELLNYIYLFLYVHL